MGTTTQSSIDHLTKWPEAFAVPEQSSSAVAKLLVEEMVSRHGVPSEVLSNHGLALVPGLPRYVRVLIYGGGITP